MTTSTNEPTVTSANGQEVERLRAYLTAIADGAHGRASHTWIKSMANGALRGDPILVGDMGNLRQIPAEHPPRDPKICDHKSPITGKPTLHDNGECYLCDSFPVSGSGGT